MWHPYHKVATLLLCQARLIAMLKYANKRVPFDSNVLTSISTHKNILVRLSCATVHVYLSSNKSPKEYLKITIKKLEPVTYLSQCCNRNQISTTIMCQDSITARKAFWTTTSESTYKLKTQRKLGRDAPNWPTNWCNSLLLSVAWSYVRDWGAS